MKVQTALRFDKELLDRVKEKAQAQKRSLNNYIEYLLYREVGDIPNEETVKAIHEARTSKKLKPIDDLDKFLDNI
ncbi:MAG: hypothetical protein ACFHWX_01835 [Bacteroidota bacterium]